MANNARKPARNSPEEVARLCEQWKGAAYREANRLIRRLPDDALNAAGGEDAIRSEALYALFNVARLYQEGRVTKNKKVVTSMGTPLYLAVRRACSSLLDRSLGGRRGFPVVFRDSTEPGEQWPDGTMMSPAAPEDDGEDRSVKAVLLAARVVLTPLERRVLGRRLKGRYLDDIAAEMGRGKESVRKAAASAVRKLQEHFEPRKKRTTPVPPPSSEAASD